MLNFEIDLIKFNRIKDFIYEHSQEYSKKELYKKLPVKISYENYEMVLDYLEATNKIIIDKRDDFVIWVYNPERIKKILKKGLEVDLNE